MNFGNLILTLVLAASLAAPAVADTGDDAVAAAEAARQYRIAHEREILTSYMELLSYPNYGQDGPEIRAAAAHIQGMMEARGISTRLLESSGGVPAIYGELTTPGASRTITIYIHYDGQATFPENWVTPPFQATMRAGRWEDDAPIIDYANHEGPVEPDWRIYARSASDDKAPVAGMMAALDALKAADIPLSVNLKFFIEGEEEQGSPYLKELLEDFTVLLESDFWLFLDGPTNQRGNPQVVLGVRGSTGVNITIYGPLSGLHSGHYGNFAPNPVAGLARLIASMRDDDGRITIDGFYDDVVAPDKVSLALIDRIPEGDADLMKALGIARREHQGMRYEETIMWPALNVRGFRAGDVEERSRNVIVPTAIASLGFRLVPDQTLERLRQVVEAHVRGQGYHIVREDPDMETRLKYPRIAKMVWGGGYGASRTPPDDPYAARLIAIMERVTNGEVLVFPTLGGSLPLAHITDTLGVSLVTLPIANQDNSQHAPNENMKLGYFFRGIEYYAAVLATLGRE